MGILYVNTNARIVREHCVGQGSATLDNRAGVNMKDYFQTTYKFREMSSHVIIPMHGRINLWPKHMLCGYLWHRRAREAFILQCIQNEPQTLFDIVSKTKLWIPASFNIRLHVAHLNSQHRLPKFLLPWNAYMRTHKKSVPACTSTFERSGRRLDKTRFHVIGAILFTAQQGALHPTAVVKTRMQVAKGGLSHMSGFAVFRRILRSDGIPGVFRGFGTSAVGALPGRVLALTSLEVSKEMALKYSEHLDMSEASKIAVANGVAGLVSSIFSSSYSVPLDVICQRLMVQGLPGMPTYRGPYDVINKVLRTEGLRGLYRGFGITMLTQSPASALWWSAYGGAQHAIWRNLGYGNDSQKKPSQSELVAVQATAGTIAGACSSIITTPIDTIKTRLQVMDNYGSGRPSVMKTTRLLLDEDGWRGFYRGFGPRFLNMSLWGTSMIVTYELIKRLSVRPE